MRLCFQLLLKHITETLLFGILVSDMYVSFWPKEDNLYFFNGYIIQLSTGVGVALRSGFKEANILVYLLVCR